MCWHYAPARACQCSMSVKQTTRVFVASSDFMSKGLLQPQQSDGMELPAS